MTSVLIDVGAEVVTWSSFLIPPAEDQLCYYLKFELVMCLSECDLQHRKSVDGNVARIHFSMSSFKTRVLFARICLLVIV